MKIEVQNLTKTYTQGEDSITALDQVSFSVSSGEFICITGRSGSGKSTLLNIMAGLTRPTSGTVTCSGHDIFALSDDALSSYRNVNLGLLPQVSSVLSSLTVLENVCLPFYLARREGSAEKEAMRLLTMVGLEKLANRKPKRLSGGQVKRVAIARALINKPDFLFVDEPTGDLDTETTGKIMRLFQEIAEKGTAVVMITHDMDTTNFARRRFMMQDGKLSPVGQ